MSSLMRLALAIEGLEFSCCCLAGGSLQSHAMWPFLPQFQQTTVQLCFPDSLSIAWALPVCTDDSSLWSHLLIVCMMLSRSFSIEEATLVTASARSTSSAGCCRVTDGTYRWLDLNFLDKIPTQWWQ